MKQISAIFNEFSFGRTPARLSWNAVCNSTAGSSPQPQGQIRFIMEPMMLNYISSWHYFQDSCACVVLCVNYLVCHDPWEQLRGFHLLSGWVPGYLPGRSLCITPELHLLSITGGLLKPALPAPRPQFILPPTVVAGPHLHSTLTAPSFCA